MLDQQTASERIDRSALLARACLGNPTLISLVAPAGYGKSSFARLLLARSGGAVLDCADLQSIPDAVRALVRCLGPFDKGIEERQIRYYLALPRDGTADGRWIDVLDEALHASTSTSALCIENAELLRERPAVANLVDRVIRAGRRSFIICSRIRLSLPAIVRIAPNDRFEISIDDLRFTDEEIYRLFDPLEVDPTLLRKVIDLANGWPIAALMFLRAATEERLRVVLEDATLASGLSTLGDYTLSEALGSLSTEARVVLAAAALLRRLSERDLSAMTDRPQEVREEFLACPLVTKIGDVFEVHPLAISALVPLRESGERILCLAATKVGEPVRAAQLYLAAGSPDDAADILDTSLAPFMMSQPTDEIASIVASLDDTVLLRHPHTWNATWMGRAFTVNSQRMLFESRTVWDSIRDSHDMMLRFGVGMSLLNWLYLTSRMDEAVAVLEEVDALTAHESADSLFRILLDAWKAFWNVRRGIAVDISPVLPIWAKAFATMPMTHSMCLYTMPGPIAFFNGHRAEERRFFEMGVDLAFVTGSETIGACAIVNAAFHAWLAGESALLASLLNRLREVSVPSVAPATAHFIGCATADAPSSLEVGTELQYMRAFGWLIAASRETSSAGRHAALLAAVDAATGDGQPWLLAMTWASLGLAIPAARNEAFSHAREYSAQVHYEHFQEAIGLMLRGKVPPSWPSLRKLASSESTHGSIFIGLHSREVRVGSHQITLSKREAELLLALSLVDQPLDRQTLAAMIWPDLDEKSASNAVGVYITRLRQRLGDLDLIESRKSGYALKYAVRVDLMMLEELAATGSITGGLEGSLATFLTAGEMQLPQWVLLSEWLTPYVRRFEIAASKVREAGFFSGDGAAGSPGAPPNSGLRGVARKGL